MSWIFFYSIELVYIFISIEILFVIVVVIFFFCRRQM